MAVAAAVAAAPAAVALALAVRKRTTDFFDTCLNKTCNEPTAKK